MKKVLEVNDIGYITADEVSSYRVIYGISKRSKDTYKAHRVGNNEYAFIDMRGVFCYGTGVYSTVVELVKHSGSLDIYVFDSYAESVKWLAEQC